MTSTRKVCVAGDIGGTFTDLVVQGPFGRVTRKVLTTTARPEVGLLNGARQLLDGVGLRFEDVDTFVHGTTLATNAILERKGARTALVTTEGYRDVLEIGNEGRFDQYDLQLTKPQPLIPRELRLTIDERIDASGAVRKRFSSSALAEVIAGLKAHRVESVAIVLLHAYANAQHEYAVAEAIGRELPDVSISLSSDVCPEIGEYERASTTAANGYVKPLIDGYLARMTAALAEARFRGALYLVTSGGGLTSIQTARQYPVRLVESGPAGGAIYAARRARELGCDRVVSFDMGGTTAKICLIQYGAPLSSSSFEVDRTQRFMKGSGLPLRIPSVELVEIGAGGGSIAHVDLLNNVTVGPESAGATPGPACYPNGGESGTVTDAALVLGLLDPADFAGGRIRLSPERAAASLERAVGKRLRMTPRVAALAVYEAVCESMASAIRVHAAERGEPITEHTMIAFGGAAPLHAAAVAEKVGIGRVVIPTHAGVGSAIGFLEAPHAFELVKSKHVRLEVANDIALDAFLAELSRETRRLLADEERRMDAVERRTAFMRYVGQGHEIAVHVPQEPGALTRESLRSAFEAKYQDLFSRIIPGAAIEIMSWSVSVSIPVMSSCNAPCVGRASTERQAGFRRVYDGTSSRWIDVPVIRRTDLSMGDSITGPAIIIEDETSTFVSPRFDATIDPSGCIVMTRRVAVSGAVASQSSVILRQTLWNRLLALVEEQAQVLIRTAFSPLVRACGDVSVGIFDTTGRMLAQAVTGTPGHVNTMAQSVTHFLRRYPLESMRLGDVFITNDPWMGTGHLNDFVVLTPVFYRGVCVGLFCCTSHLMDIGGLGAGTEALDVHAEGLHIPILKLVDEGVVNQTLIDMLAANSRLPVDIVGDTYALVACNDAGVHRLRETMEDFALTNIDALADYIVETSRQAVLANIAQLPKGTWSSDMVLDGYEEPLLIRSTLTISDAGIHIDFTGSADAASKGINVPLTYAAAYSTFAIGCAIAPSIPNNAGSLQPITVSAPAGCIVNAQRPSPVGARHVVGQMLPDVIFGCLAQAIPDRVPAEGASCMWNISLRGAFAHGDRRGKPYAIAVTTSGGTGARFTKDGLSATAFPSGIRCMPIEIAETQVPFIFWRKELRSDSAGPGCTRGGLGQLIEFENVEGVPFRFSAAFERVHHPARGRFGGLPGAPGFIGVAAGEPLKGKGLHHIPAGARVVMHTPGGGGMGHPTERPTSGVLRDVREGLVSRESARANYRWPGDPDDPRSLALHEALKGS